MKKQTLKYGFLMALTLGGSASLAQDPAQTLKDLIKKVQPTPPAKGATTNAPATESPPAAATTAQPAPAGPTPTTSTPAAPAAAAAPAPAPALLPRYSLSADGSQVTDRTTRLVWRRCAEGMTWNGITCTGEASNFTSLQKVLRHGQAQAATGWRVPTLTELQSLVYLPFEGTQAERGAAGHDARAFPATPPKAFWTKTLFIVGGDRDRTRVIMFDNGLEHFRDNGENGALRMVRNAPGNTAAGAPDPIPIEKALGNHPVEAGQRYAVAAGANEVTDQKTKLVWRRCAEGMRATAAGCSGTPLAVDYTAALAHVRKSQAGGWRLPTPDELASIADPARFKMAIDTAAFPDTPPAPFWTSKREGEDTAKAVNFYNGRFASRYHTNAHHLRLVRDPL